MGHHASTVFTAPEDVARLKRWVEELAVNARVRVHQADGAVAEGVVTVTPTVQVFEVEDGTQGLNGVVHLEDPTRPGWSDVVWLGDIERVEHLDSVSTGASRA